MAAIARSTPKPLAEHTLITSKTKYRYVRIKEQMQHAIGGRNGSSLFSTDDSQPSSLFGGNIFAPFDVAGDGSSSPAITSMESNDQTSQGAHKTPVVAA